MWLETTLQVGKKKKKQGPLFLWKHIYGRKPKQFSFTNLHKTVSKLPRSLVPCLCLYSLCRQLHQNPGGAMRSFITCMEIQSWWWEKLQDHWFITQVYKYLPCSSKFFPSFMVLFKGSQEITWGIPIHITQEALSTGEYVYFVVKKVCK